MSCEEEVRTTGPTADFTYTANYLIVSFTDASTAGDGAISTWAWDFSDGETSGQQNPVHTYAEDGTYSVSLTVTDENSLADTYTEVITLETPALAPLNFSATNIGYYSVVLSWVDNSDNEDGFSIERSISDSTSFIEIGTVGEGLTTFTDMNLQPGTAYYYRVKAYNDMGSAYSNIAIATTLISTLLLTPESISITTNTVGELNLQIEDLEIAIFGISLRIGYDLTSVSFTGATEFGEGFFFGSETITFIKDTSSAIHIATTLTSGEAVSGSGTLYTLEFEGKSQGSHPVEILPEFLFFYDESGSEITIPNLTIKSATINVE